MTTAQIADAAVKMRQVGALSVEGLWDMLGWDEARKRQERERLSAEQVADPIVAATRNLAAGTGNAPVNG